MAREALAGGSIATPRRAKLLRALCGACGLGLIAYAASDHPWYGGEPGFGNVQLAIAFAGALLVVASWLALAWVKRALVLTISSVFALLALELGVSVVFGPRYRPAYVYDATLLFKLAPSRWSEWKRAEHNGGGRFLTRTNADGYVGDELLPAGKRPRVVVFGDSFIHSYYTAHEDTFTEQLERALGGKVGTEVEVVNAGVAAYGPDQIALRMETELPALKPDLVVISIFGGNDFGDLVRNKMYRVQPDGSVAANGYRLAPHVRSLFELNQRESTLVRALRQAKRSLGELGQRVEPGHRDPIELRALRQIMHGVPPAMLSTPPENDDLKVALADAFLARAQAEYEESSLRRHIVVNTHEDFFDADVALMPSSESARYKVSLMSGVLARIVATTKHANVPLVFLFIPHPLDATDDYDLGRVDPSRYPEYRRENITDALCTIGERLGVPYLNLYDVYRPLRGSKLYHAGGEDHWNELGQRLAAQAMADLIQRGALLSKGRGVE